MLDIREHLLYEDIRKVTSVENDHLFRHRDVIIHCEGEDVKPLFVVSIDVIRDYAEDYMTKYFVELLLIDNDLIQLIYPSRGTLEATITNFDNGKQITTRYKMMITRSNNITGDVNEISKFTSVGSGTMELSVVRFQLIELAVEPITLLSVGGVFKSNSRLDLIHHLIKNNVDKVNVDGRKIIDEISIDEMNNTDTINQMVIPHMIDLLALPRFIQSKAGGCYKGGIGSFIQRYQNKMKWFIYPTYDLTRFDKANSKLIVYVIDNTYNTLWESSYLEDGGTTMIVANGSSMDTNALHGRDVNKKYGIRVVDESSVNKGPYKVTETDITGQKRGIYKEVAHKAKPDGLHQIANPHPTITSNESAAKESVLFETGVQMTLEWKNSKYELLRPGMKMRIYRESFGKVEILDGVLLGSHTLRSRATDGVSQEPLIEHTSISCFTQHKQFI